MLAIVFAGQGTQTAGMGVDLFEKSVAARRVFTEAESLLGWSVINLCRHGATSDALSANTQIAILTTEIALLEALREGCWVRPSFVAGHSLGEYAALVAAGALQFSEAVRLVNERAALMNAIADGSRGMLAVAGVDEVRIKQVLHCYEEVHIACFNSPDQLVLAGPLAQLKALGGALESDGGRCSMLNVSDAFHSPWMQPCTQRFAEHLERANWSAFDSTPVANVTGQPYPRERCKWPDLLTRQLQEPVRWAQICKFLYSQGVTHVLEISPRPVLSALARSVQPALVAMHLGSPVHLRQAQEFVTAAESGALDFVGRCLAKAACARNYLSAQEQFPTSWRSIYSHLMDKYTQAQEAPGENHEQLAAAALGFLRGVLDAKGVPLDEQRSSLQEIAWIAPYGLSNAMVSAE